MTIQSSRLAALLLCLAGGLAACKKSPSAPQAPAAHADPATTRATPAMAQVDSGAAAGADARSVQVDADIDGVPSTVGNIPPFPYVAYPPKLRPGSASTEASPMGVATLIVGKSTRMVAGRTMVRTFDDAHASMSALEVRRNYENAMTSIGAVKVNALGPDDAVLAGANGGAAAFRKTLNVPYAGMSYDVYLARQGAARHWIVVMQNADMTRLLTIEEKTAAPAAGQASAPALATETGPVPLAVAQPAETLDVPVSNAVLPPFPYLTYPPGVNQAFQETTDANFDAVRVIVADGLRDVEGHVQTLGFLNRHSGMAQAELLRHYQARLKDLGAVKVSKVGIADKKILAAITGDNGNRFRLLEQKMRVPEPDMSYESYLIRSAGKNIWVGLMTNDSRTRILVVDEKTMRQSVALVTADAMRKELVAKGKVTLYINFDTDKAGIRVDGRPAVEEIATLMRNDATLRLAIEGHTDDSGDRAHNQTLSRQRAEAVVQYLSRAGIDAGRLRAAGHGADQPLADNKDEAGRAKNRRVELIRI